MSLTRPRDLFCAGHAFLADGRLLLTGGHLYQGAYGLGVPDVDIFDPTASTFAPAPPMAVARWYPSSVELGNGSVLTFGGNVNGATQASLVEHYDPVTNTMTSLPASANRAMSTYPRVNLLPDGRIVFTNQNRTQLFSPATNTWAASAYSLYGGRGVSGSAVLLPGLQRILQFGGSNKTSGVTATAEIIDFSSATPAWRYTAPMNYPRVWANSVLLPDGTVLAVGGGTGGTYTNPVLQAEVFNPVTETWTVLAAQQAPRVYHSTAVLLPDGRVLSAGQDSGGFASTIEVFSPPYLFRGARPTITGAPAQLGYGEAFTISTPDAASISRVALVKPGSVTHSTNVDQRYVDLSFSASDGGTLDVTSPPTGNHAPPGWYMLFILNAAGVPSVASWVQVRDPAAQPPPPTITAFSPGEGDVGTAVTVTGSGFTGASTVTFNGVTAVFSTDSASQITATLPAGATTGPIRVTTAGGTATSATSFVVTAPPQPPTPYRDAVLGHAPAAYWRLAETAGGAVDQTGHSIAGTYSAGVVRGVAGALTTESNLAAQFNGTNAYVSVPDNTFLDVGDVFTYELWLRRGATIGVTQRLLHKGGGPAALGFGTNNRLVFLPGGTGAATTASSSVAITDQNWHHVVVTKNGSDRHIYLDGVEVTVLGTNTTMTNNATSFNIGRTSSGSGYFAGDIDEVAVYPVALSLEQVVAHYTAGRG